MGIALLRDYRFAAMGQRNMGPLFERTITGCRSSSALGPPGADFLCVLDNGSYRPINVGRDIAF